ncbi:MAG: hypothetical protein WCQ21_07670, partial [Verrucomicrobiota bacterium]
FGTRETEPQFLAALDKNVGAPADHQRLANTPSNVPCARLRSSPIAGHLDRSLCLFTLSRQNAGAPPGTPACCRLTVPEFPLRLKN